MENQEQIELDVIITGPTGITNRELDKLRAELFAEMNEDLSSEDVEMYQVAASRAVDPITLGTISLVLLPVVIGKIADSLIKRLPSKECSATIYVPPYGEITYDPRTTSPDELRSWSDSMRQASQVKDSTDSQES